MTNTGSATRTSATSVQHEARARRLLEEVFDCGGDVAIKKLASEFAAIEDRAVEWVRLHVSGIAAPNAEDLGEMRDWARGEHPYQEKASGAK
jgi:hypothetical protein